MADVATIVDVDVYVRYVPGGQEVGEDIRTFTTLYRMTGKKYLLENWRTDYCVSLITSARSRIAWYLHL